MKHVRASIMKAIAHLAPVLQQFPKQDDRVHWTMTLKGIILLLASGTQLEWKGVKFLGITDPGHSICKARV